MPKAGTSRSGSNRIRAELPEAKKDLAELEAQYYGHLHFEIAHPEALRYLERLDDQIAAAAYELDLERVDPTASSPSPDW